MSLDTDLWRPVVSVVSWFDRTQGGTPPVINRLESPLRIDISPIISPINHSEIGLKNQLS